MALKRGQLRSADATDVQKYIGRGFAWPLQVGRDGKLLMAEGLEHIKCCVWRNAIYPRGGYPGVWAFGGGLLSRVFAVSASSTYRRAEEDVEQSMKTYEPRVKSVQAVVGRSTTVDSDLVCTVIYEVMYTNRADSVQVPGLVTLQE
jgi:uncharacterized protein